MNSKFISDIFGKKATDCNSQCPVCNKVHDKDSNAVALAGRIICVCD